MNRVAYAVLSLAILLTMTLPTRAVVEEGVAKHIPWSGYWWPVAKGELLGPLEKYDTVSGKHAQWWELENKPPGPHVPPWHGYCHGWSAAAVLEREPIRPQLARSLDRGSVMLSVGDQKGWYSASHASDVANYYGDRYGDGEGSEDIQDLAPDELWRLLKTFIKENGVALVMDLDAGEPVWNYPVFAYRIEYYPSPRGNGWYDGYLQLGAADDSVPPDFVGTVPYLQNYTFVVQMRDGAVVLGSGRWTGYSVTNHPDFAWYPYVAMPENPEIQYKTVKSLVGTGSTSTAAVNRRFDSWLGYRRDSENDSGHDTDVPLPLGPLQLVAAIADKSSDFGLDADLAEFGRVRYQVGERFAIAGSSEEDGYLYALHVSPEGELTLLHPAPGADNRVIADAPFQVPGLPARHCLTTAPFGNHRIKVLVTKRPLSLTGLDRNGPAGSIGKMWAKAVANNGELPYWQGHGFRFFPSQHKQVKALLTDYIHNKNLEEEPLSQIDTRHVLGKFAQDEITYYVGPNE